MNVVIPPLIFYVVGAALVAGGAVRALALGRRNPSREIADDDPAKTRARRRHLTFGLVWVAMGLFLIASTAGVLRTRAATSNPSQVRARPPGGSPPVIRLDPARPTTLEPPAKP
jgi:hypothetical protein